MVVNRPNPIARRCIAAARNTSGRQHSGRVARCRISGHESDRLLQEFMRSPDARIAIGNNREASTASNAAQSYRTSTTFNVSKVYTSVTIRTLVPLRCTRCAVSHFCTRSASSTHCTTGSHFIGLLATHPSAGGNWMGAATEEVPCRPRRRWCRTGGGWMEGCITRGSWRECTRI